MWGRLDTLARRSVRLSRHDPRSTPYFRSVCMSRMNVALGADHAGWTLKESLKSWLLDQGHDVIDFGTHSPDSVDYPDYAAQVAESVAVGKVERGVLVCGTGLGMAIAANKVP